MTTLKEAREAALKPCPFCQCKAELGGFESSWHVRCTDEECWASSHGSPWVEAEDAIAAWNRRALLDAPEGREGVLAEVIKTMDRIGCDWRDAGDMTKFYATNYLVDAIRSLSGTPPGTGEGG